MPKSCTKQTKVSPVTLLRIAEACTTPHYELNAIVVEVPISLSNHTKFGQKVFSNEDTTTWLKITHRGSNKRKTIPYTSPSKTAFIISAHPDGRSAKDMFAYLQENITEAYLSHVQGKDLTTHQQRLLDSYIEKTFSDLLTPNNTPSWQTRVIPAAAAADSTTTGLSWQDVVRPRPPIEIDSPLEHLSEELRNPPLAL